MPRHNSNLANARIDRIRTSLKKFSGLSLADGAVSKSIKSSALAVALAVGSLSSPATAGEQLEATDDIYWVLSLDLAEGQDDAFDALMADMVMASKAESGTKGYEWHRDGNAVHIVERFETNADAGVHLSNFGANFAEQFLAILTPTGLQVYGPAEGPVREGLAGFGATFYDQVGGFER